MTDTGTLYWLTGDDLLPVVRRMTGAEDTTLISWTFDPLVGGAGSGLGVWLLLGNALRGATVAQWSLVLKGWKRPEGEVDPASFDDAHREMELYRSGLLNEIPDGIRAPRYFGDMVGPDGSVWVWLEDLATIPQPMWNPDRYAKVARHLGRFNGEWLAGRPLPNHPALSRNWLRQWVEASGPSLERLVAEADHPVLRRAFTPRTIETYTRLWNNRQAHYALLDRLPRTFAHLDAFPRNMFFRPRPDGGEDIVLIDWSFAGIAGIGEELVPLVTASAIFMDVPIVEARELLEDVLEHYIDGLRDTGWKGDPGPVRAGYLTAVLLRYGVGALRVILPILLGEWPREAVEQLIGHPFDELIENGIAFDEWMCDLAEDI